MDLIILHALLLFGIFFTASKVVKLRSEVSPFNFLFYLFAFSAIIGTLNEPVRCHLFSFLLFTVFIYILERVRRGNNKFIYLIPAITLFWNNIHGGVVSGLGLCLMYALGEFLNKKPYKDYMIVFAISSLVLFINPWGFDYIKFLLMANTMDRSEIVEWWSIFSSFHLFRQILFKLYMIIMIATETVYVFKIIKQYGKNFYLNIDKTKYIVLLATLYLAVSHVKLIPLFIITSLCFVYEDFYKLIKNIKLPSIKDKLVYGLVLFISLFTLLTRDISLPVGFNRYPVKEVEFIKINNLQGKLLADFGYGSYISYKLYPNNLIFMDGRYEEVYYDYMVPILKEFFLANKNWDYVLKNYRPDVMIIQKSYPIYEKLSKLKGWQLVYNGDLFGVFVPSETAKSNYIQPTNNQEYYKNSLFDTNIKF